MGAVQTNGSTCLQYSSLHFYAATREQTDIRSGGPKMDSIAIDNEPFS